MHPNRAFHTATDDENLAFARERGFGILAVCAPDGPLMSHIPVLISEDGSTAWLHLVRSNPIARLKDPEMAAKIAITGPDSYVSPDWYGVDDQVPTWNYVAVHVSGRLKRLPVDALRDVIDRQSAHFEDRLAPKPPWKTGKVTEDVLHRMMRMIIPFEMRISRIEGTWKLNQNKTDEARLSAADRVEAQGMGADPAMLSALMRGA
ncbi:MAG: FMN-binding negative transcriptional regulator [Pseudomonadota bacterium]